MGAPVALPSHQYSCPALFEEDTFEHPQQIPEIMDITKPYAYYVFPYTYILLLKFNLQNRQRKSLATITNNITEQLYKMLLKNFCD